VVCVSWKGSAPGERLDLRNGLVVYSGHDFALETGPFRVGSVRPVLCGSFRARTDVFLCSTFLS
jgi:hypothetical protein